eukprot:TRINITY_DN16209_c0_g2_i1.p1 TRINITY_DN16209_c0_g2~~TRINITY_DN16209_c0_g2_i1.p1  ORF type:complete len:211 (+),score=45.56 TRINITY_DN16209_c0_g2_i1:92-724(+)
MASGSAGQISDQVFSTDHSDQERLAQLNSGGLAEDQPDGIGDIDIQIVDSSIGNYSAVQSGANGAVAPGQPALQRGSTGTVATAPSADKPGTIDIIYEDMPREIREVFQEWDTDGSGRVNASELMQAALTSRQIKKEYSYTKRIACALFWSIIFMFGGMFAVSFGAVEFTKDFFVSNEDPRMKNKNGDTVQSVMDLRRASKSVVQQGRSW